MQQLISIIVPVYNVRPYIEECLQSIVSQTYKNLEIILVDDGSTDGSSTVCDEWAKLDSRIRVIHTVNRGVAKARNTGIQICTGDLIGFIDADDWIENNMYMHLSEACEKADMVSCGWISYDGGNGQPVCCGKKQVYTRDFEEAVILLYEKDEYFTSVCNKLFRRCVIMPDNQPILFEHDLYVGEDELWLIKVMENCDTFMFIPRHCYHYRPRGGSTTRISSITEKQMSVLSAKEKTIHELEGYESAKKYAQSAMHSHVFSMMIRCYTQGEKKKLARLRRALKSTRNSWIKVCDMPTMGKLETLLLELEMCFGLPGSIVEITNNTRRHGTKH